MLLANLAWLCHLKWIEFGNRSSNKERKKRKKPNIHLLMCHWFCIRKKKEIRTEAHTQIKIETQTLTSTSQKHKKNRNKNINRYRNRKTNKNKNRNRKINRNRKRNTNTNIQKDTLKEIIINVLNIWHFKMKKTISQLKRSGQRRHQVRNVFVFMKGKSSKQKKNFFEIFFKICLLKKLNYFFICYILKLNGKLS